MAQKDLHSIIKHQIAVPLGAFTVDGNTDGVGFDTTFIQSLEFIMIVGEITVSNFTLTLVLQHSDTDSGYVDVPDNEILGDPALAFIAQADDESTVSLGYIGSKRFTRARMVAANTGSSEGTLFAGTILVADNARHIPFIAVPTP